MLKKLKAKLKKGPVGKIYKLLKKVRNRIYKYRTLRITFPNAYYKNAKKPVDENKVVFVEVRLPEITNSFKLLYDEIVANYDYDVHTHFLRNTFVSRKEYIQRCKDMMADIATAKYVFVNEASNVVSCVKLRPETILTQTWHGCGAFKKFGFSTAELIFGETRKEMTKFPYYKNYTHLTLSSPEIAWAYEEAMNLGDNKECIKPIGTSRTDIFYDEKFINASYDKLHHYMPSSCGKKVILYAPTFRGRVANGQTPNMLSVPLFMEKLGEEYVLLIKHHPLVRKPPVIPGECTEFAQDFTDAMSIEELLAVSDICISDYSSLVFEYSLFEKPMIFFSYDLSEYFDWRGFYYDYHELTPGPVFKTNLEMIDYIQNIEERFDKQRVKDFRNKFMSACDGHATERIMNLVFGESLTTHKREAALDGEFHSVPNANVMYSERIRRIELLAAAKAKYMKVYNECRKNGIETGKVVILYQNSISATLKHVFDKLKNKGVENIKMLNAAQVEEGKLCEVVREIAQAEYVILAETCELINALDIREETKVIQMWDKVFPFEKFGYSTREVRGGLKNDYLKVLPLHKNYDQVLLASNNLSDIYKEAFGVTDKEINPIGAVATDVLFDVEYKKKALEKLYEVFPEAQGKKVIFYLPEPRYTLTRPTKRIFVNHQMMNEYLNKDYVVVYYYDTEELSQPKLSKYYSSFIKNMTKVMSITELMLIADIMIGDYKEEVFSFAVTEKPIFLYAPDYGTYFYNTDAYYQYSEVAPGPIITDEKELTEAILNIDKYDMTSVKEFKQKYLTNCDGRVVERLVDIIVK